MEWISVISPVAGTILNTPSTNIPNEASPNLSNIRLFDNYLEKGKGAAAFSDTDTVSLDGIVMRLDQFGKDAGTDHLLAMTTTKVYELLAGTFEDRAYADFTGDQDDVFYSNVYNNVFIFGNGKDTLRKWTTSGADDADLINATTYRPNWIQVFGQRLCLYAEKVGVTEYPRRLRWCVAGDPEDWAGSGSGAKDLRVELIDGDEIIRAEPIGNSVVIYGIRSTAMQDYRADATAPFPTASMSAVIGLVAPHALVNIAGGEHIILSLDNLNSYKGGKSATPIDAAIHNDLFDNINRQYMSRSFMTFASEKDRVRLFYPRGADTSPGDFFELDLKGMRWTKGTRDYTGHGRYLDASNDLYVMYGDASGVVFEDDETDLNLGSVAIDGYWESKDFQGEGQNQDTWNTWSTLLLDLKGGGNDKVIVEFSSDQGLSWVAAPSRMAVVSTNWKTYRFDFQIDSSLFRFRVRNNLLSETFACRMFKVGFESGTMMGIV